MDRIKDVSTEITDHRLTEEKLAKENAFYQAIIEQVTEGLCVCHEMPDCTNIEFTVWNKRMVEITGYTHEEVNHLEWRQPVYADPEQQESFVERIARVRSRQKLLGEGQKRVGEEWKITRKDGQKRILSVYTTFISSGTGPVHVVGIVHDITEKKGQKKLSRGTQSI